MHGHFFVARGSPCCRHWARHGDRPMRQLLSHRWRMLYRVMQKALACTRASRGILQLSQSSCAIDLAIQSMETRWRRRTRLDWPVPLDSHILSIELHHALDLQADSRRAPFAARERVGAASRRWRTSRSESRGSGGVIRQPHGNGVAGRSADADGRTALDRGEGQRSIVGWLALRLCDPPYDCSHPSLHRSWRGSPSGGRGTTRHFPSTCTRPIRQRAARSGCQASAV